MKKSLLSNLVITTRKRIGEMVDEENSQLLKRMKEYETKLENIESGGLGGGVKLDFLRSYSEMLQEEMSQYSDFIYNLDGSDFRKIAVESLSESIAEFDAEEHKDIVEHTSRLWALSFGAFGLFSQSDFDLTREQIFGAQRQSEMRYALDPHARSIIDNLCSYVIGRGVKVKTNSPELNKFLSQVYWDFNGMETYHKERFKKFLLRGEHFNRYKVRTLEDRNDEPWRGFRFAVLEIPSPEVMDVEYRENRFPVSYLRDFMDDNDKEKNRAYPDIELDRYVDEMGLTPSKYFQSEEGEQGSVQTRTPDGMDKAYEPVEDEPVMFMKLGHGRRGRPFLLQVLRYLQYLEDIKRDATRLVHEQSRVIMIVYDSRSDRDKAGTVFPAPAGGMALVGIKDEVEYEFTNPKVDGTGFKEIARMIQLSISAGSRSPEIVIFYDASNTVYASINASSNPYLNTIADFQDLHMEELMKEIKYCIRQAVETGSLPEKMKISVFDQETAFEMQSVFDEAVSAIRSGEDADVGEAEDKLKELFGEGEKVEIKTVDIPVEVIHPEVKDTDEKAQAEAFKIHQDMGWGSRFTISAKLGYDPVKELGNILREEQLKAARIQREMDKISQGKGIGGTGDKPDDDQDEE